MAKLTPDVITELLHSPSAPAVTVYMPTHPTHAPPNISEDRLRFKNLHAKVMDIIRQSPEIDLESIKAVDTRLRQIHGDLSFWEQRTQGLAVCINPALTMTIELPIGSGEYVAVDERFHVSPLAGLLYESINYYVLLVSEKTPLLFRGDEYDLHQENIALPVSGVNGSQAIAANQEVNHLQPVRADAQPVLFGHDVSVVNGDERLQFFRQIDQAMRNKADVEIPLILAGTDSDITDYISVSDYPHILSARLPNATTEADIHRLFPHAAGIARRETIDPGRREVLARYEQLRGNGSGLATDELPAIEDAADKGRIEALLMRTLRMTTDNVQNEELAVPKLIFLPDEQMAIADYIAVQTWRNSGEIIPLEDTSTETTPTGTVISAIFRY